MPNPSIRLPSLSRVLLLLCAIAAALSIAWALLNGSQVHELRLATGDPEGEGFILSQAIAQVVTANDPKLHITVLPTSGTEENLRLLENGKADFVTAQADVPAGPSARTVAVLYRDLFQLVVRRDSGIREFTDLQGRTVLLQPNSGEFYSFLELATHYGLSLEDFQLMFANGKEADELFRQKQADALFRVRTLNNDSNQRQQTTSNSTLAPLNCPLRLNLWGDGTEATDIIIQSLTI